MSPDIDVVREFAAGLAPVDKVEKELLDLVKGLGNDLGDLLGREERVRRRR